MAASSVHVQSDETITLDDSTMDNAGIRLETLSISQNANNANQDAVKKCMVQTRDNNVACPNAPAAIQSTIDRSESGVEYLSHSTREPNQGRSSSPFGQTWCKLKQYCFCLPPAKAKAIIGTVIALLTLIVTIVALLPAFSTRQYDKAALKLAMWTAKKDYLEVCQQVGGKRKYPNLR